MPADHRAVLVPYDRGWQQQGVALLATLRDTLGHSVLRAEHIGSTAIPGMAAKNVLDLQLSVADLAAAQATFDGPLQSLGFSRAPFEHDHVPAGWDSTPQQWAKRLWVRRRHVGGDVNLHVRRAGAPNERLALLFRDWFHAHPEAVPAYALFKQTLALAVPNSGVYSEVKDPVVDLVITVAEPWAQTTGWDSTT